MSLELSFDWKSFNSPNFGTIYRPVAIVEVKSQTGEWKTFFPEIDSGSPVTLFNKSDCDFLGYTLDKGKPLNIYGVLGGCTPAYLHDSEIKVGKEIIPAKIAFTDGRNHKQLLGRLDVFEKFGIFFHGKILKTGFIRE